MFAVICTFLNDTVIEMNRPMPVYEVKENIFDLWGFGEDDLYLLYNGKRMPDNTIIKNGIVYAVPRLIGGKGGFGSMLRAIGAQIEKTTNREACRDLSGRRLRDINEEKRLKNWIAQQAEREREAAERKRKKLERLRAEPKHNFHDQTYEEERSQLTEKVSDAVEQGFRLAASSNGSSGCGNKRKAPSTAASATKKKKPCLWMDADEDLSSSVDSEDSDDGDSMQPGPSSKGQKLPVDSDNAAEAKIYVKQERKTDCATMVSL